MGYFVACFEAAMVAAIAAGDLPRQVPRRSVEALLTYFQGLMLVATLHDWPEVLRDLAAIVPVLLGRAPETISR